jgi:type II secretory pathway pseudopilin PulG
MEMPMKRNERGFSLIEILIAFGLVGVLVILLAQLATYAGQGAASSWSSLDYADFATRVYNIVLNDDFCSQALAQNNQTMSPAGPQAIKIYDPTGAVQFDAGTKFKSLTVQSISLDTLDPGNRPTSAGGVWPSLLTFKLTRPDTSSPFVLQLMLNVSTATATFQIQKCNKVKFSEQNYAAPPCPAAAPVDNCSNATVPFMLTVDNDGVTPICVPDWTQCCDHATSYPVQMGPDPKAKPYGTDVRCRLYYCNGPVLTDAYAKGICCSHGLSSYGPAQPASCP